MLLFTNSHARTCKKFTVLEIVIQMFVFFNEKIFIMAEIQEYPIQDIKDKKLLGWIRDLLNNCFLKG
jgi:hypothetical protein